MKLKRKSRKLSFLALMKDTTMIFFFFTGHLLSGTTGNCKVCTGFQTGDYLVISSHLFPFAGQHQSRWIEAYKDNSECSSPLLHDQTKILQSTLAYSSQPKPHNPHTNQSKQRRRSQGSNSSPSSFLSLMLTGMTLDASSCLCCNDK